MHNYHSQLMHDNRFLRCFVCFLLVAAVGCQKSPPTSMIFWTGMYIYGIFPINILSARQKI